MIAKTDQKILKTLLLPVVVCSVFLVARIFITDSGRYLFLFWNLLLAMIPLAVLFVLKNNLRLARLTSPMNVILTFVFVAFLPNAFYIVTDYTHLRGASEININYDILLITAFAVTGLLWGYCATLEFHRQLETRLGAKKALGLISLVFLASSFAIYLGRFVRWNSWDILFQPAAIIFDVSEQVINPRMHENAYYYTGAFFLFLISIHLVLRQLIKAYSSDKE